MMRRILGSRSRRLLLQGAVAVAVIAGAATQWAAPASAYDGDWWRYHRFAQHDPYWDHGYRGRGGVTVYAGPPYYYAPPPAYYPPPQPPGYYAEPPAPSFSFGLHVR